MVHTLPTGPWVIKPVASLREQANKDWDRSRGRKVYSGCLVAWLVGWAANDTAGQDFSSVKFATQTNGGEQSGETGAEWEVRKTVPCCHSYIFLSSLLTRGITVKALNLNLITATSNIQKKNKH